MEIIFWLNLFAAPAMFYAASLFWEDRRYGLAKLTALGALCCATIFVIVAFLAPATR